MENIVSVKKINQQEHSLDQGVHFGFIVLFLRNPRKSNPQKFKVLDERIKFQQISGGYVSYDSCRDQKGAKH